MYYELNGDQGPFFKFMDGDQDLGSPADIQVQEVRGTASFLREDLTVDSEVGNKFTNDLTRQDDVLVAVLSLVLLLVIQGIVSTVLLRTRDGKVSTFSFAVKQVVELAREFRLKRIWEGPKGVDTFNTRSKKNRIDIRLVMIAIVVVLGTFGLEVLILFLTEREGRSVTNRRVALKLEYPFNPDWGAVRFHNRASLNRPCLALALFGDVDQGKSRITTCVTTSLGTDAFDKFENATEIQQLSIYSTVHDYGMNHAVQIGENDVASYEARAFFSLGDQRQRIMSRAGDLPAVTFERMRVLHRQYLAILFNTYKQEIDDEAMNLERLQEIDGNINFGEAEVTEDIPIVTASDGNETKVLKSSKSRQFFSQVNATLPFGRAALRAAQPVFKSSMAVQVRQWNSRDLFVDGKEEDAVAEIWSEQVRVINWLSLTIILGIAIFILGLLRFFLKPIATAEIAALFVRDAVGAPWDRPGIQTGGNDRSGFLPRRRPRSGMQVTGMEPSPDGNTGGSFSVPMSSFTSVPVDMGEVHRMDGAGLRGTSGDYIFRSAGISHHRRMAQSSADISMEMDGIDGRVSGNHR